MANAPVSAGDPWEHQMAKQWIWVSAAASLLAGCATNYDGISTVPAGAVERVTYETGPCYGTCPVYRIVVGADGKGVFTGIRNTAVTGERAFTLSAGQYRAFADALSPYRPSTGDRIYQPGNALCANAPTDMPSVDIRWAISRSEPQRLYFYYGCDREKNRAMATALGNAPDLLPLEQLIGPRP
ncbi:DUF6438 domain-containing protein [Sphingomonas sp. M1-B02]|uniref:DUF6438 domain-containing protein n=1 Tax=Sphingomonas sp. M1-B02 TaxID=3114300 RepID=UPI00223F9FB9|nr:DUF6438 domain-containing protein [Sphingomonas sp. S6-11]UZK64620.1 DUF6438 domain-containing protein [Sphingomonas sp. S6-11]